MIPAPATFVALDLIFACFPPAGLVALAGRALLGPRDA
jgi:hypothetical protein